MSTHVVAEQPNEPVGVATPKFAGQRRRRPGLPAAYLSSPVLVLLVFFAGPLLILAWYSFTDQSRGGTGAWTWENYRTALQPFYLRVARDTVLVALGAMALLLAISYPLAYVIAFRSRKWEVPLLLTLVLSDELNPVIRIYAWRTVLGRQGLINTMLGWVGVEPLEWLIFTRFSVLLVLTVSWLPFCVIPIYAAMKTIDRSVIEAARDLGSSSVAVFTKVLLPLTATGFVAAVIVVFIPIISDYAAPALVGGTDGLMISAIIEDEFLGRGNWGTGSALTFLLLAASALVVVASYRISRVRQLDTAVG